MPGRMLGLAPGRSGACVGDWLAEQTPAFRDAIEIVLIDTSAPYASGSAPRCLARGSRSTSGTCWPTIHVAVTMEVTNARTEGLNRIIKNTKRVACGFRNLENYQRRILSTIALTRTRRDAA
jgi:transposase